MSCHVLPCLANFCYVFSCLAMSCYALACLAMSCHALTRLAMLWHIVPCLAMYCRVLSNLAMSCHVFQETSRFSIFDSLCICVFVYVVYHCVYVSSFVQMCFHCLFQSFFQCLLHCFICARSQLIMFPSFLLLYCFILFLRLCQSMCLSLLLCLRHGLFHCFIVFLIYFFFLRNYAIVNSTVRLVVHPLMPTVDKKLSTRSTSVRFSLFLGFAIRC